MTHSRTHAFGSYMYMLYAVVFFGQILAFFVSVLSLAIMNREQIPPYNVFSAIVVPGGGGGGARGNNPL